MLAGCPFFSFTCKKFANAFQTCKWNSTRQHWGFLFMPRTLDQPNGNTFRYLIGFFKYCRYPVWVCCVSFTILEEVMRHGKSCINVVSALLIRAIVCRLCEYLHYSCHGLEKKEKLHNRLQSYLSNLVLLLMQPFFLLKALSSLFYIGTLVLVSVCMPLDC